MYDVIIVGAGASGILTSIILGRKGLSTVVLDRMDKPCKKIYATGNGKCNFTNMDMSCKYYYSDGDVPYNIISQFNNNDVIHYFEDCKILSYERDGYVYPASRQASAVAIQLVETAIGTGNVKIKTECNVKAIDKTDEGFVVTYEEKNSQKKYDRKMIKGLKVVIATGGKSGDRLGSDGSGYYFASRLGHNIIKPLPGLVHLKCQEEFKEIAGVRVIADVTLYEENNGQKNILGRQYGEIIFNEDNVSGIPVFQLSLIAVRMLDEDKKVYLSIDFAHEFNKESVEEFVKDKKEYSNSLRGIIPEKLAVYFQKKYSNEKKIVDAIKGWKLRLTGYGDFNKSQVSTGGVDMTQIDAHTMESKLVGGLYMTGEVLDVAGICGGYNLQWAWSSAYAAAKHISSSLS